MSIIPLTVFFSLLLAGTFVVLFVREQRRRRFASAEHDSLLPLAEETPRLAAADDSHVSDTGGRGFRSPPVPIRKQAGLGNPALQPSSDDDHDDDHDHAHDHAHGHGACGCARGLRPPCTGCLRRTGATATAPLIHPRARATPSP